MHLFALFHKKCKKCIFLKKYFPPLHVILTYFLTKKFLPSFAPKIEAPGNPALCAIPRDPLFIWP